MIPLQIYSLVLLAEISFCFNLDTNFPIVYVDPSDYLINVPSNKSSYFGYSLVLYPGNHINAPWIQIGAPRANSPKVNYKNPGVVFKCGIGDTCSLVEVDTAQSTRPAQENFPTGILEDAWIGGTMDINYKNDRVVICGYRWTKSTSNDYRMIGSCYWSHVNDNTTQKLLPLFDKNRDIYTNDIGSVYDWAQGQAGFSVHLTSDANELFLGAPGVFNWAGTSLIYRDSVDVPPIASRYQRVKRSSNEFENLQVADARITTQTRSYDLTGYSVTSGNFYKKNQLLYVTSAPKSEKYLGKVLIHAFFKATNTALDVRETKVGTQFGEYFGGSLTAGDINNDGYDDLIVGAPFYMSEKYNEGRIHVFLGSPKGRLQDPDQGKTIVGKGVNGQFGTTLQYLGDLNRDGFGDVAVAAPYEEDGSGVVYLFRGSTKGLDITPCQRIVGRDISREIRGFGKSISRPADVDFNRYADVAIGAYVSGHAVLLRTRPTATVYHSLESNLARLDYDQRSFEVQACFSLKPDNNFNGVNISRVVTVDEQLGRANLQDTLTSKDLHLSQNETKCENITINLKEKFANHYDPISISLSHRLIMNDRPKEVVYVSNKVIGTDRFCPRCPVYDTFGSSKPATVSVPFALGCGNDNICDSNLELEPKFANIDIDDTFVLGSSDFVKLETSVTNTGENAYLTEILVVLPEALNFKQIPAFCMEQNSSAALCSVENPLKSMATKTVGLDLDMNNVNSGRYEDSLVVSVMVLTSSENKNSAKSRSLTMKLKREADITISGKSDEQSYSYGNITFGKPNFTQTYQVQKFGISPIDEVLIVLNVPHAIENAKGDKINFIALYPPIGALAGQPINCKSNFTYVLEERSIDTLLDGETQNTAPKLRRSVRQVEVFKNFSTDKKNEELAVAQNLDLLQNRTFHVNCSMAEVTCSKVLCTAGPFKSQQHIAVIDLKMMFDVSAINGLVGKRDIISLTTHGSVMIQRPSNFVQSGDKPDSVQVSSIFVGEAVKPKIELWIIVVSVIAGLLLLLLLVLGLIKAGFFKRTKKEELEQLKEELVQERQETETEDRSEEKGLVDE